MSIDPDEDDTDQDHDYTEADADEDRGHERREMGERAYWREFFRLWPAPKE